MNRLVSRDERETAIDLAADRLAFLVLAFGLLIAVMYRSFVLGEASWDLIGLVVLAGAAGYVYRLQAGVATRRWLSVRFLTVVLAAVAAAALIVLLTGR
ncbi:MAG: hypothetical protein HY263_09315 [Chloroflexi bacterium]|nr:hypothetical protein [Chloroflexota bacterium]